MVEKAPLRAIDVRHMRTGHNHALPRAESRHSVGCGCGECRDCSGARSYDPFSNAGRRSHAPTTVGGTADGTRRSTAGTLNIGTWAGTSDQTPWPRTLPVMSSLPPLRPSQGSNSGAHRESYSTHTYAFQRSCNNDSCNTPSQRLAAESAAPAASVCSMECFMTSHACLARPLPLSLLTHVTLLPNPTPIAQAGTISTTDSLHHMSSEVSRSSAWQAGE